MRLFQTNIVFWWCNYNWVFSSSAMLFKVHSSSSDLSIKLQELEGDTTASCLGPCASLVCASSATQCLASNAVGALALAAVGGAYAAPAAAAGAVHFSSGFGQVAGGCVSASVTSSARTALRRKFGLGRDARLSDFWLHFWCGPCAIAQEARELRRYMAEAAVAQGQRSREKIETLAPQVQDMAPGAPPPKTCALELLPETGPP
uniref:Uncharacterized protein n=1 Tax=Tetraselmis sp. GSL018 TaxID=582737 RepID=A0A061SDZ2_9CHLO